MDLATALKKYKAGSTKDFDTILSSLSDPSLKDQQFVDLFQQLIKCIILLGKDFQVAIGIILNVNWLERSGTTYVTYQSFVVNLISAHPMYLRPCLRMIVKNFMPTVTVELIDDELRHKHEKQFCALHALLLRISQIVPMSPVVLVPLMGESFPFMTKSTYLHEVYVMNLLQVTTYLPAQRTKILSIIVERMATLDSRAPRASIELEDDADSDDEESSIIQFEMDGDQISGDLQPQTLEKMLEDDTSFQDDPARDPMRLPEADRLDVIMNVMLRFIQTWCYPNDELDWDATKKLYLDLLSIFDRIILPTYALCHTQFLLFYICSFKEALTTGFIDFLWKKVAAPLTQIIFRQTAISYIASLLARAKYINLRLVQSTVDVVIEWVHKYVAEASQSMSKVDVCHHGTFYAVCQAIFYVIVFRHKDLLATTKGHKFVQQLNLQTVVTSRLNPLKFCLPIIVKTFASVMRQHQLVFCDTIIERNRRSVLSVEGDDILFTVNPLDSFFPFDPYLLSRSAVLIKPIYQEYTGVPATEDDTRTEQEELDLDGEMGLTPTFSVSASPNTDFFMFGSSSGFMST